MKKVMNFVVRSNERLNHQNHLLKVYPENNEKLTEIFPGQFVQILVENSATTFLRRPISVNFVDTSKNELWLLIQAVGEGTRKVCATGQGQMLNLIFPLGNSFQVPDKDGNYLLVGGGVGTAPMLFLGKTMTDAGIKPNFLLGGRSKIDLLQLDEFEKYGTVYCTTEDGTWGEKGFVTHHSILKNNHFDRIFTCGPKPMMVAIARYAHENKISCEVSLENLMACGLGACLCCIEKTVRGNVCACTEGPVFNIKDLLWTD